MQQRRVTHMKEYETKKKELVYKGSKSHGLSLLQSIQAQEIFTCQHKCKEIKGEQHNSQSSQMPKTRYIHKPSKIIIHHRGKS